MQNVHRMTIQGAKKEERGRKAQIANITAGKAVADIIRTTLGPRSMLKMILDPMGGIVMTNDGNAILREVDVSHPAAKSMIELARAQDEEVGDGTTSVVVLAGEVLAVAEALLEKQIHPTLIVTGYMQALEMALQVMDDIALKLDVNNHEQLIEVINTCVGTKFSSRWGDLVSSLALKAAQTVCIDLGAGKKEIDVKRYAKVEKLPGGSIEDCQVLNGVMFNKNVTHPKMAKIIHKPRICLLDCTLEYKKGESVTNVEVVREEDWEKLLKEEEEEIARMCNDIIATGCNVVITEKGVADLAQHYLLKAGIAVIRRVRKTDNVRIARVTGATICNRTDELTKEDIGTKCGLFKIEKIGDDYFTFLLECEEPKACTILLRGASKDVLNELERNLHDAMFVARNILLEPKLLPGGGATEMEIASRLLDKADTIESLTKWSFRAIASAIEIIPKTLIQNCGVDVVRTITTLRSHHAKANEGKAMGLNGETGQIVDVEKIGVWDTFSTKQQIYKSALESACMILRIDDILSGISRRKAGSAGPSDEPQEDEATFGDNRDG